MSETEVRELRGERALKKEKKKTRKINKRKVNKLTVQRKKKNYL